MNKSSYKWNDAILNAAEYGVPQLRKRFVAIGSKHFKPQFPMPTHGESIDLLGTKKYVSLWESLSDLPFVELGDRKGQFKYKLKPQSEYQILMREDSQEIYNHTAQNHSERVLEKIRSINQGEYMGKLIGVYHENKVPYCGGYRRALKDNPSWTAYWTRGMTSIHPEFDRFLTPRECARIQSFPDRFIFQGSTIENYTQICNAVPPLLAKAIGKQVSLQFNEYFNSKIKRKENIYNQSVYASAS